MYSRRAFLGTSLAAATVAAVGLPAVAEAAPLPIELSRAEVNLAALKNSVNAYKGLSPDALQWLHDRCLSQNRDNPLFSSDNMPEEVAEYTRVVDESLKTLMRYSDELNWDDPAFESSEEVKFLNDEVSEVFNNKESIYAQGIEAIASAENQHIVVVAGVRHMLSTMRMRIVPDAMESFPIFSNKYQKLILNA